MIRRDFKFLKRQMINMDDGQTKKNVAFSVMLPANNRRRKRIRKRSFTEALREKYCINDPNKMYTSGFVVNIFVTGKPKANGSDAELAYLRNVVLNDCSVGHAGLPNEGLVNICPNVVDLDLSSNCLSSWKDALEILSHLKCLKFVNLARNPLKNSDNVLQSWSSVLPEVENLVLNDTGITWPEILLVAKHIPVLKELHICGNDYEEVTDDGQLNQHFRNLQCLRLNNNKIQRWNEVWKLKHLPELESLILSGNPLKHIFYENGDECENCESMEDNKGQNITNTNKSTEEAIDEIVDVLVSRTFKKIEESFHSTNSSNETCEDSSKSTDMSKKKEDNCDSKKREDVKAFSKLKLLCVSETKLNDWAHMMELGKYPQLESVRLKDIPLASKLTQDDRRKLHIASLPKIKILNGSEISSTERDKAERHFIRYFMDKKKKPEMFHQLEAKHGKLLPLVDVDLRRSCYKEWINLTLKYKNQEVTEKVQAKDAVGKLRLLAADKFNLYACVKMLKLFHSPCGPCHREGEELELQELIRRTESLPMSRFDIMDGDVIYVDGGESPAEQNTPEGSLCSQALEKKTSSPTEVTDILQKGLHDAQDPGILSMDVNPRNSSKIVTGGKDNCAVVFSKDLGQVMVILQGHKDEVNHVVYHPEEDVVVTSSADCTVRVWDARKARCLHTIDAHNGPIRGLDLHPSGDYVLTSSMDKVNSLCFDKNGDFLAIGGSDIRFYSCKTWKELRVFTEHSSIITRVKFADDASFLASTNVRGSLKFYSES
ncbi:hypothetical protein FSP39_009625 [Pinctada imbricata]|uniref:Pre-mRNA-processing factor 19 n=1 Tax=Pinctada imbricata TaxID=66713 RepID=A0AA88Y1Z7_PINIB|nr:hypothetical protein FSP39_009625 [Pinctada imbricata]